MPDPTPESRAELRRLADAAYAHMIPPTEGVNPDWYNFDWLMREFCDTEDDARFIEAFNPAVVRTLLNEQQAAESALEAAARPAFPRYCAYCTGRCELADHTSNEHAAWLVWRAGQQ